MPKFQVPYNFTGAGYFHIEAASAEEAAQIAAYMPVNNKFNTQDFEVLDPCITEVKTDADAHPFPWSDEDADDLMEARYAAFGEEASDA